MFGFATAAMKHHLVPLYNPQVPSHSGLKYEGCAWGVVQPPLAPISAADACFRGFRTICRGDGMYEIEPSSVNAAGPDRHELNRMRAPIWQLA